MKIAKLWKSLRDWFKSIFCQEADELAECMIDKEELLEDINDMQSYSRTLEGKIIELEKQIPQENPKEICHNTKYPSKIITYIGRTIPNYGSYSTDVRCFFVNPEASELKAIVSKYEGKTDDEKARLIQKWIVNNIKYTSDKTQYGLNEFWAFPQETLKTKKGDCDDGGILMANLMLSSGIPYWKIRITAGDTPIGGHAYVTYFCEETDQWVALDWCYHEDSSINVSKKPDYKESPIYGDVWFSFNSKYAFSKSG